MYGGRTVGEQFLDWADKDHERPFSDLRIGTQSIRTSYGDAANLAAGIGEYMAREGFVRGDRIVLYLGDVHDTLFWLIACLCRGIVPVPLDPIASPTYVETLLTTAGAKGVFTTPDAAERLAGLDVPVLTWDESPRHGRPRVDRHVSESLLFLRDSLPSPEDIAVIQPSSGTTGAPKLMLRNHYPIMRHTEMFCFDFFGDGSSQRRRLMANAMTHGAGILDFGGLIGAGAVACIPNRPNIETSLQEVKDLAPDIVNLVPRIIQHLYDQHIATSTDPDSEPLLGPNARFIIWGGSSMPPAMRVFLERQGLNVLEVYGCTECGLIGVTTPEEIRPGWSKILPDIEVRVESDGELLVRSQAKMVGYINADENQKSYTEEGFYRTGDLGAVEDGWVQIRGRKKDVFGTPSGGILFPSRLETMLEGIPQVRQAILVGSGRRFLTALVVPDWDDADLQSVAPSIRKSRAAELISGAIGKMNTSLETEERTLRFDIVDDPFPLTLYKMVGQGKVSRKRAEIERHFGGMIEALYSSASPAGFQVEEKPDDATR